MALTKSDHRLEQVSFVFDEVGDVKDVVLTVNYAITEDISGREPELGDRLASGKA